MLKRDNISTPIAVLFETVEPAFSSGKQQHLYSEFIFIKSGTGSITTEVQTIAFEAGDVFFFKRNREHEFTTQTTVEVYRLCITEQARLVLKDLVEHSNGRALRLAKAQSPLLPKITLNTDDRLLTHQLFELMLALSKSIEINENLLYFQCINLISIIERNVHFEAADPRPVQKPKINFILRHIHKNLTDPELLSLPFIANKYNLTPNRLGQYFKQEMNQSVKQYIMQVRMKEVGKKVKSGTQSFSEIAHQYGFTDESHFYKTFKKHYKKSPTEYRKASS